MVYDVTADTFKKEVTESNIPVLIDFWSHWCAPCGPLGEILEQMSLIRTDIKFVRILADEEPELCYIFNITNLPTLLLFDQGRTKLVTSGWHTKEEIEEFIRKGLA